MSRIRHYSFPQIRIIRVTLYVLQRNFNNRIKTFNRIKALFRKIDQLLFRKF